MNKVERWQLEQRASLPLEEKIILSEKRIRAWIDHYDGDVYVAFSGGRDSTALLHLVREIDPDIPAAFMNTGVEFPEIVRFVRSTPNVTWIKPKKSFTQVINEYGYPFPSKRLAQYIHEVQHSRGETNTKRLRLTGYRTDGTHSPMGMISKKWQYLCTSGVCFSDRCCYWLKKRPAKIAEAKFGAPILGVRAVESKQRTQMYLTNGCNAFHLKRPRSNPLSFWTADDVINYISTRNVPYSPIYDMGYTSTGCFPCMFGVHMEKGENRFQKMYKTHPKLWNMCMDRWGMQAVLDLVGIESK